jgi:putative NIF3 family GTP cyclohydrolase 1 type 2
MKLNRRNFIANTAKAAGAGLFLSSPLISLAHASRESVTVGQIMDAFIKEIPGAPFPNTVDTLKAGNRDIVVTGIVTTMFATIDVIKKAIELNANFIIAHEPTFYNHQDEVTWLAKDPVYQYKLNLLKEHNIAVWRNHDYIHHHQPDGVRKGLVDRLGWTQFEMNSNHTIYNLTPAPTLKDLIAHLKQRLDIPMVRFIGDTSQICGKVLLMPGAAGGSAQIQSIVRYQPDVLVCGEIAEWETAEYVRDARAKGQALSLVLLGHIASEEAGAEFMLGWLKEKYPAIKTTHIPSGNSLSFL